MSITVLCWYTSGLFLLSCLVTSIISYAPGEETAAAVLQIATGSATLLSGIAALRLSVLPVDHWIRQSKPAWAGYVAAALTLATLLLIVG